ncbi:MAG TPA: preprotein translocase subunit SecG [Psychromonas hadalis]|nr:preprotein translocase subunit SecG [Psychromonas hadalis]
MYEILLVVYLIVAIALIGFVLIQQGKGAGMGASFGSGASNTVFGASGAGNFMTRTTAILAVAFFVLSLTLGNLSTNKVSTNDTFSDLTVDQTIEVPVDAPVVEKDTSSDIPE